MAEDEFTPNYALTKPHHILKSDYHRALERIDARLVGRGPVDDRPADMAGDALWFVTDGDANTPDDTLTRWDPDAAEWVSVGADIEGGVGTESEPVPDVYTDSLDVTNDAYIGGSLDVGAAIYGDRVDVNDVYSGGVYGDISSIDEMHSELVDSTEVYDGGERAMRADGWEIVMNDEVADTDKYLRFEEPTDDDMYGTTISRTADNRTSDGQSGWNGIAVEPNTEIAGFRVKVSANTTELERVGIQTHQQGGTDWIHLESFGKLSPGDEVDVIISDTADYLQSGQQYDVLLDNSGDGYSRGSYEDSNQYRYSSSDFDVISGMYSAGASTQSDYYNINDITAITDP